MGFFVKRRYEELESETLPAKIEADNYRPKAKCTTTANTETRISNLILRQARNEDERLLFEEKMRQLSE